MTQAALQSGTTYAELLKQKQELEQMLEEARKRESSSAVAKCRELIDQFKLTPDDLFGTARGSKKNAGTPVAPKYRDPATGQTWTGRGKPPKWIADQDREQFAI